MKKEEKNKREERREEKRMRRERGTHPKRRLSSGGCDGNEVQKPRMTDGGGRGMGESPWSATEAKFHASVSLLVSLVTRGGREGVCK